MRHRACGALILILISLPDPAVAQAVDEVRTLEEDCAADDSSACLDLAERYERGDGVVEDLVKAAQAYQRAAALFRKACEDGDSGACSLLAGQYEGGKGVPMDSAMAERLYQSALLLRQKECAAGYFAVCSSAARQYEKGEGVAKNLAKAAEFYNKGCRSGDHFSCYWAARLYEGGEGGAKNLAKAAELYQMACAAGAGGCYNLALLYEKGKGVAKDLAKAAGFYQKACEDDDSDAEACFNLALLYESGKGVARDLAKAVAFFQKACENKDGVAAACFNSALMHERGEGVAKDLAGAAEFYRKACEGGYAPACGKLGLAYDEGTGVPKDDARAALFFQKGCDGGFADGCFNLGVSYATGEGVLRSGAAAAEMYHKAGLAYLKEGEKADALRCVERIQNLAKQGLTVPNAFLADQLLRVIYQAGSSQPAAKKTPTEPQPVRPTTPKKAFGTGWFVSGDLAVTNHHVVARAKKVRVVLADGVSLEARVVVTDATNDLVLLKVRAGAQLPPPLPLASGPARSGETVFTLGHPYPTLLGSEAKVTDGVISATSGLADDPRLLQVSVPIQPGNSGGPLLNMRGEVVGIVISKLNAAAVFRWSGDLPENVGYAIKLGYLSPLLPSQPAPRLGPSPTRGLADLVARTSPSVVLVVAE